MDIKRHINIIPAFLFFFLAGSLQAGDLDQLILKPALSLLGSPYVNGAMGPDRFDCSGFVSYLYRPHYLNLPRISRDMAQSGKPVQRAALLPGDLVFFATGSARGRITHVAIYIGQDSLVHAISNGPDRGVTVTRLSSRYWNSRYHSSRRVLPDAFYAFHSGSTSTSVAEKPGRENPGPAPATATAPAHADEQSCESAPAPVEQQPFTSAAEASRVFAKGTYQGEFEGGEPSGYGSIRFNNGDRYDGNFAGGYPHGSGEYHWVNGDRYTGAFQKGALHGEGTFIFKDGSRAGALLNQGRVVSIRRRATGGTALQVRSGALYQSYLQVEDSP